jgi:hypothetical protein
MPKVEFSSCKLWVIRDEGEEALAKQNLGLCWPSRQKEGEFVVVDRPKWLTKVRCRWPKLLTNTSLFCNQKLHANIDYDSFKLSKTLNKSLRAFFAVDVFSDSTSHSTSWTCRFVSLEKEDMRTHCNDINYKTIQSQYLCWFLWVSIGCDLSVTFWTSNWSSSS